MEHDEGDRNKKRKKVLITVAVARVARLDDEKCFD